MEAEDLIKRWIEEAAVLRLRGAPAQAELLESCAEELRGCVEQWRLEELTVEQAAAESGFSESHLRRLVHENRIQNVGGNRRLRVRRCDLPRKAGGSSPRASSQEPDLAAQVLRARGLEIP